MERRSRHGGRHELGQNLLHHLPTIDQIVTLVSATRGAILEIGAGDGALTAPLSRLGRELLAIDIDEHSIRRLRRRLPRVRVEHADGLTTPLDRPVIVSNVPFHLTTPILRRLLSEGGWQHAVLLTQWEVARKRAGVGGRTMMTAQCDPWFEFRLHARVPAHGFHPRPSVDGGVLEIRRRRVPLLPAEERRGYEDFVRRVFTARGADLGSRLAYVVPGLGRREALRLLERAGTTASALPRSLSAIHWSALWTLLGDGRGRRRARVTP